MKQIFLKLLLGALVTGLSGCAALFDKDNTPAPAPLTPLPAHTPTVKVLWRQSTGGGANTEYLRLTPVIEGSRIFTAAEKGQITALNRLTGQVLWQTDTHLSLSAGLAANAHQLFVGTRDGTLIALDQTKGTRLWTVSTSSALLSPPAATNTTVVVKSIDGYLTAYSAADGKKRWSTLQKEPDLILHNASSPRLALGDIFAGFEDGSLARYSLTHGTQRWIQAIAEPKGIFPIERMVDLDSDPVVTSRHVYAATWQGRLASVNVTNGDVEWAKPVSTYTPLAYDGQSVYLSDATGTVAAYGAAHGNTLWKQTLLKARRLTGPALNGRYLVLGDAEGWIHWLNKRNGTIATRYYAGGGGIFATPQVNRNIIYFVTKDGQMTACQIGY